MNNNYKKTVIFFLIAAVLLQFLSSNISVVKSDNYTDEQREKLIRFGITAPLGVVGYDLSTIHALTYLDWAKESSTVPAGVEYIHVLKMRFVKVSDDKENGDLDEIAFQQFKAELPDLIQRNPSSVWIIGNEPDRKVVQDDLTPKKYAERFFEVATIINNVDESALVGFGSIVQPTPIRLRYLERSLAELSNLAGSRESALALIDIWSIHAFILNEVGTWGADIPPGFNCEVENCEDAISITDFSDTYSIDIFIKRIQNFRDWMKLIGEQDKPLWITEYGSLFYYWEVYCPDQDDEYCQNPINGWPTETDTIDFMIDSFDFLLYSTSINSGYLVDNNKLVQRWYWYSLNDKLDKFGGTLFDPDNNKQITKLGIAYKNYLELLIGPKIFLPILIKSRIVNQ